MKTLVGYHQLTLWLELIKSVHHVDVPYGVLVALCKTATMTCDVVQIHYKELILSVREYLVDKQVSLRCLKDNILITLTITKGDLCPSLEIVDVTPQPHVFDDVDDFGGLYNENDETDFR